VYGINNRVVMAAIDRAIFFELSQKQAIDADPKYRRKDAPATPNTGKILDRRVSIETVPGTNHGKPPKKKSLDSSINNKAEAI